MFVSLLLLFEFLTLGVALRDATVGLLCCVELAGGFFDAAHRGLVTGEDAQVVLLAEAVEELLDVLGGIQTVRAGGR